MKRLDSVFQTPYIILCGLKRTQAAGPSNATRVCALHRYLPHDGTHYLFILEFINDHIRKLPDSEKKWEYWIDIFGKACQTEKAFFDLAYEDLKYDVVSDGLYKIRSYGKDGHYLVPCEGGGVVALQDAPDENLAVRDFDHGGTCQRPKLTRLGSGS